MPCCYRQRLWDEEGSIKSHRLRASVNLIPFLLWEWMDGIRQSENSFTDRRARLIVRPYRHTFFRILILGIDFSSLVISFTTKIPLSSLQYWTESICVSFDKTFSSVIFQCSSSSWYSFFLSSLLGKPNPQHDGFHLHINW